MVDILVVAGCEVVVHAAGRQEGAGELQLRAFRQHFLLLCLVTVVLEPDLDLCGAMSEVFVFFRCTAIYYFFPKNEKNSKIWPLFNFKSLSLRSSSTSSSLSPFSPELVRGWVCLRSSPSQKRSSNAAGETDVPTRKSEPGHSLILVFTGVAEIRSAQKEELEALEGQEEEIFPSVQRYQSTIPTICPKMCERNIASDQHHSSYYSAPPPVHRICRLCRHEFADFLVPILQA